MASKRTRLQAKLAKEEDDWLELEKELRLLVRKNPKLAGKPYEEDSSEWESDNCSWAGSEHEVLEVDRKRIKRDEDTAAIFQLDSESDDGESQGSLSDEDSEESSESSGSVKPRKKKLGDCYDCADENVICEIPVPVPIPRLDGAMRRAIAEGRMHEKSVMNRFVRICADFYMAIKRHPSKEDYNNICLGLIAAVPDLRDPVQKPGQPPFLVFKNKLTQRVCHLRRESMQSRTLRPERVYDDDFQTPCPLKSTNMPHTPEPRVPACPAAVERAPCHIPVPAPLPPFRPHLLSALAVGRQLSSKVRNSFLNTCTDFYLRLKYFPTSEDYDNICRSLVGAFPVLADSGSAPGNVGFSCLKKDLCSYFCSFRHRHDVDRLRGEPGAGSWPPLGSWVDALVMLKKDGEDDATTSDMGLPTSPRAPTSLPSGDRSAFDSFFNADPTHEDVERNIQQLRSLINELQ